MEHIWIPTWVTDELEGYICGNCERECLEPSETNLPCEKSKPPKKKQKIVIETRYMGDLPFPSWQKWHKYKTYDSRKSALMALVSINNDGRRGSFQYRIRPEKKD